MKKYDEICVEWIIANLQKIKIKDFITILKSFLKSRSK